MVATSAARASAGRSVPAAARSQSLARSFCFDSLEVPMDSPMPKVPNRQRSVMVTSPDSDPVVREGSITPHNRDSEIPSSILKAGLTPARTNTPAPRAPAQSSVSRVAQRTSQQAATPSARRSKQQMIEDGAVTPYLKAWQASRAAAADSSDDDVVVSPPSTADPTPRNTNPAVRAVRSALDIPCDTPAAWKVQGQLPINVDDSDERRPRTTQEIGDEAILEAEALEAEEMADAQLRSKRGAKSRAKRDARSRREPSSDDTTPRRLEAAARKRADMMDRKKEQLRAKHSEHDTKVQAAKKTSKSAAAKREEEAQQRAAERATKAGQAKAQRSGGMQSRIKRRNSSKAPTEIDTESDADHSLVSVSETPMRPVRRIKKSESVPHDELGDVLLGRREKKGAASASPRRGKSKREARGKSKSVEPMILRRRPSGNVVPAGASPYSPMDDLPSDVDDYTPSPLQHRKHSNATKKQPKSKPAPKHAAEKPVAKASKKQSKKQMDEEAELAALEREIAAEKAAKLASRKPRQNPRNASVTFADTRGASHIEARYAANQDRWADDFLDTGDVDDNDNGAFDAIEAAAETASPAFPFAVKATYTPQQGNASRQQSAIRTASSAVPFADVSNQFAPGNRKANNRGQPQPQQSTARAAPAGMENDPMLAFFQAAFPTRVVVPSGGSGAVRSFNNALRLPATIGRKRAL